MKDSNTKYTLLGLLVILIWATSATLIKQMVIFSNNNYLTDIVIYNALAFLVLLPVVIKRGEFKALKNKNILKALVLAVLSNGFYDLFVTSAEGMAVRIQYAQIGNYMWPMLIVLLLGIKKKNPSKAGILSTLVGFLAVLVLFVPEVMGGDGMSSKDVWALLLGVVAAFLWATYSVTLSTHEELTSCVFLIQTLGQGVSALLMFVFASSLGKFNMADVMNGPALSCIIIYATIGISLSYVLWAFVMTKHPALENFSVLSYLTPILSLVISTLYFKGTFNIQILIAGILIVFAIYISKKEDKKKLKV
jgi:drug/metabolite transporter (DMT)-like permease